MDIPQAIQILMDALVALQALFGQFAGLAGAALLGAALVNIFKLLKWVGDGTAPTWSFVINTVLFVAFVVLKVFFPAVPFDSVAGTVAQLLVWIAALFAQTKMAQLWHTKVLKGVALIGKSYSLGK